MIPWVWAIAFDMMRIKIIKLDKKTLLMFFSLLNVFFNFTSFIMNEVKDLLYVMLNHAVMLTDEDIQFIKSSRFPVSRE